MNCEIIREAKKRYTRKTVACEDQDKEVGVGSSCDGGVRISMEGDDHMYMVILSAEVVDQILATRKAAA